MGDADIRPEEGVFQFDNRVNTEAFEASGALGNDTGDGGLGNDVSSNVRRQRRGEQQAGSQRR